MPQGSLLAPFLFISHSMTFHFLEMFQAWNVFKGSRVLTRSGGRCWCSDPFCLLSLFILIRSPHRSAIDVRLNVEPLLITSSALWTFITVQPSIGGGHPSRPAPPPRPQRNKHGCEAHQTPLRFPFSRLMAPFSIVSLRSTLCRLAAEFMQM